jgi:transcriptional regulator with XRE-family HTH domain
MQAIGSVTESIMLQLSSGVGLAQDVAGMELQALGEFIRHERERQGWSQQKLAEKAKLSVRYIPVIERGGNITIDVLIRVMGALGVSRIELGETTVDLSAEQRRILDLIGGLPVDGQRRLIDFLRALQLTGNLAPVVEMPTAKTDEEFTFPIPPEDFIERDHDYPQALHTWVVPQQAAAAGLTAVSDDAYPLSTAEVVHSIRDVRNALIQVVRVKGDSMWNAADRRVLMDGDLVLVDTTLTRPKNDDVVAVYIKDEGGMIGYWSKQGDRYSLLKENPDYGRVELGEPQSWLLWGTVTKLVERTIERRRR